MNSFIITGKNNGYGKYIPNIIKKTINSNFKKEYNVKEIINLKGRNDIKKLDNLKKKVGVYIFANKNCKPVYIGLAGAIKKGKHSLKNRLQIQLNADLSNSTLVKNIREIENLMIKSTSKELIERYAPKLCVIPTGEVGTNKAIESAKDLEKMLIFFLKPRYNK